MTRTVFTTISPVPLGISREVVLDFLHNHVELIDLNPLVKERHPIDPPPQHRHDEDEKDGVWYSITDHIDYLPGGRVSGDVSYTCRFRDLPNGIQTHCRAGLGVDIRETWTLCGALPGEPRALAAAELGPLAAGAPSSGLYLREDCDLRCNLLMTGFVKKNLKKAHAVLVQRLVEKSRVMSSSSSSSSRKAGGGGRRRRGEEDDDEDDEDDAPSLASIPSYYMPLPSGLGTTAAEPTPSSSSLLSSSSLSPPPPSSNDVVRPASYSGYPVGDAGRTSSPPLFGINNTSVVGGHRPTGLDPFPAVQDEQQQQHHQNNSRGRASTESSSYRLYSQYDNIPDQPPAPGVLFPFALRVPAGPTPPAAVAPYAVLVERHENNNHNHNYNNNNSYNSYNSYPPPQRPSTRVDPELCPTPLRIRGLSAGSSTSAGAATVTSPPTTTTTTRAHASSVSSHHSTTGSSSGTTIHHHTSSFGNKTRTSAGMMPRAPPSLSLGGAPRIIAPPEQHPEYPMLSPYHYEYYPAPPGGEGGRRSSSSYGSSPADDDDEDDYTQQPETPQFFSPDELVVVGDARSRVGEEEEVKYGRQRVVVEAEHPAVLRPGFGGGARVLSSSSSHKSSSGLFLAELE